MIAIDANILVHAFRSDSPQHAAQAVVNDRLARRRRTAIPWPCVHEFLAVVTNAASLRSRPLPLRLWA